MARTTLELIYPERRHINTDDVLAWGFDVKVNDAVSDYVRAHGPFDDSVDDSAFEAFVSTVVAPTLEESIAILEDAGVATFRKAVR